MMIVFFSCWYSNTVLDLYCVGIINPFTREIRMLFVVLTIALLFVAVSIGEVTPLFNSKCEDAISLSLLNLSSKFFIGTTRRNATTSTNVSLCGENLFQSPGVWYLLENQLEEDHVLTVSTCNEVTNFNTAITIYSGDSCQSLVCWNGFDDDYECEVDGQTTVSLQATAGQNYYIVIHGSQQTDTGDFGLQLNVSQSLEGDTSSRNPQSDASATASFPMLILISLIIPLVLLWVESENGLSSQLSDWMTREENNIYHKNALNYKAMNGL
jgi:hypothetical protein